MIVYIEKKAFLDYKNILLGLLCGHIFARTLDGEVLFVVEISFLSKDGCVNGC